MSVAELVLFLTLHFQSSSTVTPALSQETVETPTSITVDWKDLRNSLARSGINPEGTWPSVDVFLATPVYFSATGRTPPQEALQKPSLMFYISEDAHDELPTTPPQPLLRVDGKEIGVPMAVKIITDSEHHRTSQVLYSAVDSQGDPLITDETSLLKLIFTNPDVGESSFNVLTWELPISYTEHFSSSEVALGMPEAAIEVSDTQDNQGNSSTGLPLTSTFTLTWATILAIMSGMLIALSPCLLQLGVYFTATLAGVSTEHNSPGNLDVAAARKHVMQTGLFFALGFTLVYAAGGAAAGYIGQSLNTLGNVSAWMRPLSVVAGIVILILALRTAWNARAPIVCHLPIAPLLGKSHRTGALGAALMGISFSAGCLACFSATVLPALLLLVGSIGSVVYGTLLLTTFSLFVSVPCLVLAFGISRLQGSRLQGAVMRIQKAGPLLGLTSAVVMAGFGILMITYNFHIVSGFIGRFFGWGW